MRIQMDENVTVIRAYIGLYVLNSKESIPLCVSEYKDLVKDYLITVRNLEPSQYEIFETHLTYTDLMSLYDGLQIEVQGHVALPARDWATVYDEAKTFMSSLENTYLNMREYGNVISEIKGMDTAAECLQEDLKDMLSAITNQDTRKLLFKTKLKRSIVFTPDINLYIKHVKSIIEQRENLNEFMQKMFDDDK